MQRFAIRSLRSPALPLRPMVALRFSDQPAAPASSSESSTPVERAQEQGGGQLGRSRPFAAAVALPSAFDLPFPSLLRGRFSDMVDAIERDFFRDTASSLLGGGVGGGALGMLSQAFLTSSVDISETKDEYRLRFDLPGVRKEDINVRVEGDLLRVSAQRKPDDEAREETTHRAERTIGYIERVLRLPDNAEPDNVKASFENGVLKLCLKKQAEERQEGRTIQIE